MAPKQVYGKRPKNTSSFAVSTKFAWSSPSKASSSSPNEAARKENVESVTDSLGSLEIDNWEDKSPIRTSNRKALGDKNDNARLPIGTIRKQRTLREDTQQETTANYSLEAGIDDNDDLSLSNRDTHKSPSIAPPKAGTKREEESSGDPEIHHLEPILSFCSDGSKNSSLTTFSCWSATLEPYFTIVKIAEASYGEVYRLCLKQPHPKFTSSDESVLKILPLKPPPSTSKKRKSAAQKRRQEQMSEPSNVASEVKLLQRMTPIPGFTNFRGVLTLKGKPSQVFVDAWKTFDDAQPENEKSVFPNPSKKGSYDNEQLWTVIEMQDAGVDLEHVSLRTIWEVWDVFWGVALSLAKGEEEAKFEHRDLHLGNICVRPNRKNEVAGETSIRNFGSKKLGFAGLETTIIDYTLSRAQMTSAQDVAYLNLEEQPELFEQDAKQDYQYEIYRYMRTAVQMMEPQEDDNHISGTSQPCSLTHKRGQWEGFYPLTNAIWLHYVLHKLMQAMGDVTERVGIPRLHFGSTDENDSLGIASRTAKQLNAALSQLQSLLSVDPPSFADAVASASELVTVALNEGWLDESDVVENGGSFCSSKPPT